MKAVKTQERLFEEFIDFQKMPKTEIQQFVWIEASVREPSDDEDINYCRMYGLRLVYKSLQMMKTLTIAVWMD